MTHETFVLQAEAQQNLNDSKMNICERKSKNGRISGR